MMQLSENSLFIVLRTILSYYFFSQRIFLFLFFLYSYFNLFNKISFVNNIITLSVIMNRKDNVTIFTILLDSLQALYRVDVVEVSFFTLKMKHYLVNLSEHCSFLIVLLPHYLQISGYVTTS